jgi:glycosyltransferase involved in cell wall biosynthesis
LSTPINVILERIVGPNSLATASFISAEARKANTPSVSVITACHNSAKTIAGTLKSVCDQSFHNIEHVVVDGGSTDETLDIIHRVSVSKLLSEPDRGIYDALNKGIALSTGDIIAFLNSDDIYAGNDVIECVAEQFMAHSLDAVYGDVAFVKDDDLDRVVRLYSSKRFRPSRIAWGWMPAHPTLFVSRRIFERYGAFKTDYRIAGDFEFVARVFSAPNLRYRYVPKVLVKMRTGGISTRGWRTTLLLNREVLRACRENGINTNYLKILSKYPEKVIEFLRWR